jgi:hypothetical protein
MSKRTNQENSASRLQKLLAQRGLDISPYSLTNGDQRWRIFQCGERQVGIDAASGIWLRESESRPWRCLATTYTTSSACMAADFLTEDQ